MIDAPDVLERLEQPEYTGENRCLPCTVVNVAIALVLAAGIGIAGSALASVGAFGAFLLIIALRGYLVPGTPTLTRRYLPEWVLVRFGKSVARKPTVESAELDAAVDALEAADVVTRDTDARAGGDQADGLALTPDFRQRWHDQLVDVRADGGLQSPDEDAVAVLFDADDVDRRGDASLEIDGTRLVRWASDAALAADVAADRELRTELDGWAALDPDDRRTVLTGLRLLLDRCPACDGRLATDMERLEHCCRRPRIAVDATCENCGRTIASLAVPESSPRLEWVSNRDGGDSERSTERDLEDGA